MSVLWLLQSNEESAAAPTGVRVGVSALPIPGDWWMASKPWQSTLVLEAFLVVLYGMGEGWVQAKSGVFLEDLLHRRMALASISLSLDSSLPPILHNTIVDPHFNLCASCSIDCLFSSRSHSHGP